MNNFGEKVSFIWSVADLLRGPYRPNQYKDVMLPLTVLRRLDCVLEPTKDKVLEQQKKLLGGKVKNVDPILCRVTGVPFYNTSRYTFEKLKGDPNNIAANLTNYLKGFSARAREIIEHFGFEEHIGKLDKADRLFLVVRRFCEINLHPNVVSNIEMGYIFEELIRRFNEASNEEAGDHFTPREVIRLMVNLIFMPDSDVLTTKGIVKTLYDPACGTGGMLSVAEDYVRELNPDAQLEVFGQDYNAQAYAICGSDMMLKGQNIDHIAFGDIFTDDRFPRHRFDYMLANPPFGVEWKPEADYIKRENEEQGFAGRFGAGLPRINDGSLLFLQHMISKMKDPKEGGTRLAIVFNGSPLFTGSAGSGESEIKETRQNSGDPPMAAISLMADAAAFQPISSAVAWRFRKWTSSINKSLVTSNRRSPTRTTAQSSPMPSTTYGALGSKRAKRPIKPNSPISRTVRTIHSLPVNATHAG